MCIASISGQSMGASAAWDGRIDVEEYIDLFRIGNGSQTDRLQVKAFTESDIWEIKETVKRFYSTSSTVTLMPQSTNPEHQPQIYDLKKTKIEVLGKVVEIKVKAK